MCKVCQLLVTFTNARPETISYQRIINYYLTFCQKYELGKYFEQV
jgi:hypothetical protein